MGGNSPSCNIQQLANGVWKIERKFVHFGACRRHVNRMIRKGQKISQVSLFYNSDSSGCMEIFFLSSDNKHRIGHAPFSSAEWMKTVLRRWRSLHRPKVVEFRSNGRGGYEQADHSSWKW